MQRVRQAAAQQPAGASSRGGALLRNQLHKLELHQSVGGQLHVGLRQQERQGPRAGRQAAVDEACTAAGGQGALPAVGASWGQTIRLHRGARQRPSPCSRWQPPPTSHTSPSCHFICTARPQSLRGEGAAGAQAQQRVLPSRGCEAARQRTAGTSQPPHACRRHGTAHAAACMQTQGPPPHQLPSASASPTTISSWPNGTLHGKGRGAAGGMRAGAGGRAGEAAATAHMAGTTTTGSWDVAGARAKLR